MKSTTLRDALIGATALLGLAALTFMLVRVGELRGVGQRWYSFTLLLPTASGLTGTSPVTFNGVRIGGIERLDTAPDLRDGVLVTVRVREEVRLPRGFSVYIDRSLVGDGSLELSLPATAAAAQPPTEFVAPNDGPIKVEVETLIGRLTAGIQEPLDRLSRTADNADRFLDTYDRVGRRVEDLLAPRTTAQVAAGAEPNLSTVLARVDTALTDANAWLADEQLRTGVLDAVSKARALLEDASGAVRTWEATGRSVDERVGATADRVDAALADANKAMRQIDDAAAEVRSLAAGINAGRGTLGQLATNPDLYRNLQDAATRLEQALTEFRLLAEKYRAEGIPLKF